MYVCVLYILHTLYSILNTQYSILYIYILVYTYLSLQHLLQKRRLIWGRPLHNVEGFCQPGGPGWVGGEGLIQMCAIERVGLIHMCNIERVGLIHMCAIEQGFEYIYTPECGGFNWKWGWINVCICVNMCVCGGGGGCTICTICTYSTIKYVFYTMYSIS
jgi:hypothetical protein